MDIGVISTRYARALLKGSTEAGLQDMVYRDMLALAKAYIDVPQLKAALANPMLLKADKEKLLVAAVGEAPAELTVKFIQLVLQQEREQMMVFMANAFITLYRKQHNIIRGRLITATGVTPALEKRMQEMVQSRTSGQVEFLTEVDPDLIGGFILEYDTYRMDASVRTRLNGILSSLRQASV